MARKKSLKNLQFRIGLFGLLVDITPFRWAPYAFKTQWNIFTASRSSQLFEGLMRSHISGDG